MITLKKLLMEYFGCYLFNYLVSKNKLSDKCIVKYSGFFNKKYYSSKYSDVADSALDPLSHYLKYGPKEKRNPSKGFDSSFYHIANPEYLLTDENPIVHYVTKGKNHGALKCNVVDDSEFIRGKIQELKKCLNPSLKYYNAANKKGIKTIAFFTHNLNLEGATLVCRDIVIGIKKTKKLRPIVFSPLDGDLRRSYEESGVKVVIYDEFDKQKIDSTLKYKKFIDEISKKIQEFNVSSIYGNTILSFWTAHLATQLSVASVLHVHESEPINYHVYNKNYSFTPLIAHALEISFKVIFVSNSTKKRYDVYNKNNNFEVIKNSLDIDMMSNESLSSQLLKKNLEISSNDLVFINIGTVTNRKGQVDMINALQKLDKKITDMIHFIFVGDVNTVYSQYLHGIVNNLPGYLSCRIHFIKKTSNVFDYYNIADAFVLSSRIESYPKVIQEAMYFQLPIIATPIDGITEQIQDGVSGLFYQPGDADSLSALIERVIITPSLRKQLGRNAYSAFKKMIKPKEMIERFNLIFIASANT